MTSGRRHPADPYPGPSRRYESLWRRRGLSLVAGIDEAGRGCLAGPVTAAAVVLGDRVPKGLDDSKRLAPDRREVLFDALLGSGAVVSWATATPEEIDALNIRQASFLAMQRALDGLPQPPDALLVDGFELPSCEIPQRALIHGDGRSTSIAAASIVAKVVRDRFMVARAAEYPAYGFERHKGYPTPEHLRVLQACGPCPLHRRSFAPVRLAGGYGWQLPL